VFLFAKAFPPLLSNRHPPEKNSQPTQLFPKPSDKLDREKYRSEIGA
jgi:hypothetical protein